MGNNESAFAFLSGLLKYPLSLLTLACGFSAQATETSELDALKSLSLEDLLNLEVSVATLSTSTIDDAPGIVTVIDRRMIEQSSAKTLVDMIRFVPGFDYSRASMGWGEPLDEFYARGVYNIFSQTILFLINGRNKLNDLVYASPWMSSRVNLDMIERIEIIRGPGSALYGGNAFSAVINLITRDVASEQSLFEFKAGSYQSGSLYGLLHHQFPYSGWKLGIQGKYFFEGGDSYDSIAAQITARINEEHLNASILDQAPRVTDGINNSFDFSANLSSPKDDFRFQYWYTEHNPHPMLDDFRPQINADTYRYQVTQSFYNMEARPLPNLFIAGHYSQMIWNARLNYSQNSFDLNDGMEETFQLNTHGQVDLHYTFEFERHSLLLGSSFSHESQKDPSSLYSERPDIDLGRIAIYYAPANRDQFSLFAQDTWQINDDIAVTSGLRYDDYDDIEDGKIINPRLAAVWNLSENNRIKLLYGEAFRPPAGFEVAGTLGSVSGTSDLKPELIKTSEIAYITYFDWARLQANVYHSSVTDQIDEVGGQIVNSGRTQALGGEVELRGKDWWLNYSYTDSERQEASGAVTTTKFLSPYMVNGGLSYALNDKLKLNTQFTYRSKRPEVVDGDGKTQSHFETDFSISYQSSAIEYIVEVRNLFDTEYQLPLQYTHEAALQTYPYRGRELALKIRANL